MKTLFRLFAVFAFIVPAFGTTTVTGTMQNLGTGNSTNGAFVRFWLRGCAGNQPRITGTALIAPSQGGVYFFDFPANGSGAVTGTLYSTRDSSGNGNGDIECGGSYLAVWYGMQAFQGGKGGPEMPVHAKSTGTLDVSTITPITTNPVVTSPTGDTTYARLDGGNQPFTGSVSPSGNGTLNMGQSSHRWNLFGSALDVSGNATVGGTLGVTGNTTLGGTLGVTGAATFSGSLTANNGANFNIVFAQLLEAPTGFNLVFSGGPVGGTGSGSSALQLNQGTLGSNQNGADVQIAGGSGIGSGNGGNVLLNGGSGVLPGTLQSGSRFSVYNNRNVAGQGVVPIRCVTSQKSESAADTNVLTCTPPAVAGSYRLRFTMAVSAQNTATLGWTATWKDANGQAQSPTNLSLFVAGTAAPALTFTAATNGNYYGYADIDIDNSATNIVVKLTFTGTSFTAKVTASVEEII